MSEPRNTLDEALARVKRHADEMDAALVDLRTAWAARLALLPPVDADLRQMLEALALADDHAKDNFRLWPRTVPHDHPRHPYREGTECHAHWHEACRMRDAAVAALLRYSLALREAGGPRPDGQG